MKDDIVNLYMHRNRVFTCAILATILVVSGAMATELPIDVKAGSAIGIEGERIVEIKAPITLSGGWIYGFPKGTGTVTDVSAKVLDGENWVPEKAPNNSSANPIEKGRPWLKVGEGGSIISSTRLDLDSNGPSAQDKSKYCPTLSKKWTVGSSNGGINKYVYIDEDTRNKINADAQCATGATPEFELSDSNTLLSLAGTPQGASENNWIADDGNVYITRGISDTDDSVTSCCHVNDGGISALHVVAPFANISKTVGGGYTNLVLNGDWSGYKKGRFTSVASTSMGSGSIGTVQLQSNKSLPQSDIVIGDKTCLSLEATDGDFTYGDNIRKKVMTIISGGSIIGPKKLTLTGGNRIIFGSNAFSPKAITGWTVMKATGPGSLYAIKNYGWYGLSYGNNKWMALNFHGSVATSTNGASWTPAASLDSIYDHDWYGLSYGNNKWMALNSHGSVATSTDGIKWTSVDSLGEITINGWYGLSYGNDKWMALNSHGSVATSTDGTSWEKADSLDSIHDYEWRGLSYGNDQWMAVNLYGYTATSNSGTNWTSAGFLGSMSDVWTGVSYSGDQWMALNQFGEMATSTNDGISWTQIASLPATGWATFYGRWRGLSYGNGLWRAVDDRGYVAYGEQ
ncbi:hypothetical protein FACS1894122_04930 [Alphaproteobacteria bacterium]|nr:hypothetical protein FACS1894122_04930 [Alphaproteobacteria bacterium]